MNYKVILCLVALCMLVGIVSADTLLIYPEIDATFQRGYNTNQTWTALRGASSSNEVYKTSGENERAMLVSNTLANNFTKIETSVLLFNTTTISAGSTINSAILSMHCNFAQGGLGYFNLTLNGGTLASNTDVITSDYQRWNTIEYITRVGGATLSSNTRYNFTITNLTGIQKGGYTTFYTLFDWFVDNAPPTWQSGKTSALNFYDNEYADTSKRPFLEITYTVPDTTPPASITGGVAQTERAQKWLAKKSS